MTKTHMIMALSPNGMAKTHIYLTWSLNRMAKTHMIMALRHKCMAKGYIIKHELPTRLACVTPFPNQSGRA